MLAWGMLTFGDGYSKSGTDVLAKGKDTLRWNADYLLKTVKDDSASSALSKTPHFYIIYQVCMSAAVYTIMSISQVHSLLLCA